MFHPLVGSFVIRSGQQIIVAPSATADEDLLSLFLQGMVMGVLLQQRGLLVLHASAVAVDGKAVAFIGPSGSGKSTLAAALCARGYALVTDDIAAIDVRPPTPLIVPAFPQIKLFPDVASALGLTDAELTLLHPADEKRGCRFGAMPPAPLRLDRAYVLEAAAVDAITRLRPQDIVMELVRHSYVSPEWRHLQAEQLQQCGHVARAVSAFRLKHQPNPVDFLSLVERAEGHWQDVGEFEQS